MGLPGGEAAVEAAPAVAFPRPADLDVDVAVLVETRAAGGPEVLRHRPRHHVPTDGAAALVEPDQCTDGASV